MFHRFFGWTAVDQKSSAIWKNAILWGESLKRGEEIRANQPHGRRSPAVKGCKIHTVDGSEIRLTHQLRLVNLSSLSHYLQVFVNIPGGAEHRISEASAVLCFKVLESSWVYSEGTRRVASCIVEIAHVSHPLKLPCILGIGDGHPTFHRKSLHGMY